MTYRFPNTKKTLLSISAIYNNDRTVMFKKNNIFIIYKRKIILKRCRDKLAGLWLVPLTNKYSNTPKNIVLAKYNVAAAVIESTNTKRELVYFLYTTYYFLVKSTWIKAI